MKSTTSTTLPPVFSGTNVAAPFTVADSSTSSSLARRPAAHAPPSRTAPTPVETPAAVPAAHADKPSPGWLGNVVTQGRRFSFEAWLEGVTDTADPEVWKALEVRVHTSLNGAPERTQLLSPAERVGNNLRFELDLGAFDPFASALTHALPTVMRFHFTVNGVRFDDGGKPFETRFGGR